MTTSFRAVQARVTAILGAVLTSWMVAAPAVAQQTGSFVPSLNLSASNSPVPSADEAEAPLAQDPAAKQDSATMGFFQRTEVSGFVDTYYTYNFNKPAKECTTVGGVAVFNCLHNFDVTHSAFSLNLAEVALTKVPTADSRGGFRVDLDYGATAAMVAAFDPGGTSIYQHVQQAYASYLAPTGTGSLQFDFGKFVTHNGAEVIETKDNWNYSRGLLFSWAIPYYHTGVRATYAANDKITVMGEITNGWNNVVENNTGKTIGAEVIFKPIPAAAITLNYTGGPEQTDDNDDWRHLFDAVISYTATPQISLLFNYDYARDTVGGAKVMWQGIAAYLKYQPNAWFALVPRYEWFKDRDGFSTGVAQTVQDFTLTLEFKHTDGFMSRVEYRGDMSDQPYFLKNTTETVKNQRALTIGWVYAFSTKAP